MDQIEQDYLNVFFNARPITAEEAAIYNEGACCTVDYRSKIHETVHNSYNFGEREIPDFDYDRFFAATDTLLDVQSILYTALTEDWPANKYLGQLWMYGALQALAVEQQALRQLVRCVDGPKKLHGIDILDHINELRIAVAGHPSDHNKRGLDVKGCTFLGHQVPGSKTKFIAVTYADFQKSVQRVVDVLDLIEKQRLAVEWILAIVWKLIKEDQRFTRYLSENQS